MYPFRRCIDVEVVALDAEVREWEPKKTKFGWELAGDSFKFAKLGFVFVKITEFTGIHWLIVYIQV